MIHSLTGELIHTELNLAVIQCGGVGFACRTTANSLNYKGGLRLGETYTFLTHMNVREDAIELFGFITAQELNSFRMLLSVSGVGPKAALAILSEMPPQGFALAVVAGDVKALTRVSGIGAKIAQRIILELKDKISKQSDFDFSSGGNVAGGAGTAPAAATAGDAAVSALLVLGFSVSEAAAALAGLPADMDTSEKIKQALKRLSG